MSFTNQSPESTRLSPSQDDFEKALVREEALANFSSMNKIREGILVAMARDVQKGGDGARFLTVLAQIKDEKAFTKEMVSDLFS